MSDNDWSDVTPQTVQQVKVVDGSPLEALKAVLAEEVHRPPVVLPVPERAGVSVRFNANVEARTHRSWIKKAEIKEPGGKTSTDALKAAVLAISAQTEAILLNGVEVADKNGDFLTFKSPELRDLVGLKDFADDHAVIRKFYGVDAHVINTGSAIVDAAGFSDEVHPDEVDPTS